MEFIKTFGQIAGFGGLALGVLLLIFRDVIQKNIFATLTKQQSYNLIRLIIVLTWTIAFFGISLWGASFFVLRGTENVKPLEQERRSSQTSLPLPITTQTPLLKDTLPVSERASRPESSLSDLNRNSPSTQLTPQQVIPVKSNNEGAKANSHSQEKLAVTLVVPSDMNDAEIFVDGVSALITDRKLSFITILVDQKAGAQLFRLKKLERTCEASQLINTATTLSPCDRK